MNNSNQEIVKIKELKKRNKLFWETNQKVFKELLTFIDFADNSLNIGLVEINFAGDRDNLIQALIKDSDSQEIQFEILDFSDPNLRFLRDELVNALKQIKITSDKKLVLLITGLEKSIGVVEEYPAVLANLNYIRDDLTHSVPYPIIFFLPDYALTRLAKYAPDFWAWNRKVFKFKTVQSAINTRIDNNIFSESNLGSFPLEDKKERIDLLLRLLSEYKEDEKQQKQLNSSTLINLYTQLGVAYESIGDYKQAILYQHKSLEISGSTNDLQGKANSLNNLGNVYNFLGEYRKAIELYQQSLEITQQIGDQNGEANSLDNLGKIYYSLGEYQRAIEFHQQSLAIFQQIGNLQRKSTSLKNLGNVYDALGKYQKAIEFYQQSLEIKQQIGDSQGKAISLNNLGNTYNSLKDYQKAIKLHQQSLEIKQQIGDRNGEANSLIGLGNAYNLLGDYQQAIKFYQKSLEIKQQIGNRKGEDVCLNNLGNAYNSLGDYQKAIKLYQQSLGITKQIGNRNEEANSWFNLGDARRSLQQKSEAKTAYENALKLYQDIGLENKVQECDKALQELE